MKNLLENPTLKKVLPILVVIFIIVLAPVTMPLLFLGGCLGIWRFTKYKPNIQKRNIAVAVTVIGILGTYTVGKLNPDYIKNQTNQNQITQLSSDSSSSSTFSSQTTSSVSKSTESSSEKEKQEKERKEKELKEKQVREEQERKEAEVKQIVEEADQAVQQLENNQVTKNIATAKAAVERVIDSTTKANLTDRINSVQNAMNQRAEEARQAAASQAAQQSAEQQQAPAQSYYKNCKEARAAGVAPIYRGQPGYAKHLDRDGDGIACE